VLLIVEWVVVVVVVGQLFKYPWVSIQLLLVRVEVVAFAVPAGA
jgi:hypothetical protein